MLKCGIPLGCFLNPGRGVHPRASPQVLLIDTHTREDGIERVRVRRCAHAFLPPRTRADNMILLATAVSSSGVRAWRAIGFDHTLSAAVTGRRGEIPWQAAPQHLAHCRAGPARARWRAHCSWSRYTSPRPELSRRMGHLAERAVSECCRALSGETLL